MLTGVTTALAGSAYASFPGGNGSILFTGGASPDTDLYSIQPDGTGLRQLTNDGQAEFGAVASPDGGRIAFTKDTGETCGKIFYAQGDEIYVARADGSDAKRLTNNCPSADYGSSWSPSGKRLVFVRNGDIWTMSPEGNDQAALTCTRTQTDGEPKWSPSGQSIVFVRQGDLFTMSADGSGVRQLTSGATIYGGFDISPDGARLAFVRSTGLYVVDADGTDEHHIDTGYDWNPAWSPDGTAITFNSNRDHPNTATQALYTIRPDGSGLTKVLDNLDPSVTDWASAGGNAISGSEQDLGPTDTACPESASPTPPAVAPPPPPAAAPTPDTVLPAAGIAAPDRLRVATVSFTPKTLRSRKIVALRVGVRDQSGGLPVQGAVVSVASVPTGRVRTPVQQVTNPSGITVIRLQPTRQLELRPGRLILAVRVRKPGSPWADPVSALRLISVRTATR
jgi:Tol biopolymer transport system component